TTETIMERQCPSHSRHNPSSCILGSFKLLEIILLLHIYPVYPDIHVHDLQTHRADLNRKDENTETNSAPKVYEGYSIYPSSVAPSSLEEVWRKVHTVSECRIFGV